MPVDVWRGMNQGLASLNDTFDTMSNRRRQEKQDARQARIDALQEPILKAQGEEAVLSMEEKRRKIYDLRAFDEARKNLERNPGTVPTVTEYTPPGSMTGLASIKDRIRQGPTRMADVGDETPAEIPNTGMLPSQGLPPMEVAGTRPLTEQEKNHARKQLMLQYGRWDEMNQLGQYIDVTNKIDAQGMDKLTGVMKAIDSVNETMGPEYATAKAREWAMGLGMSKEQADTIKVTPKGIKSWMGPNGETIMVIPEGPGKNKVVVSKPNDTQIDIETKAAQGDPLSQKIIKEQEDRKATLKRIEAGSGASGAAAYVPGAAIGAAGERDENALKGLSAGDAATVKGLVDYKIPLPSGFALKTPWGQRILAAAVSYDPSFDSTQYNVRLQLKKGFNSGKEATNIRGLNTAISHLETLDRKARELSNSWSPTWNSVSNAMITAAGDPRVKGFDMAATAVESELAAVFKGMGATDQEIKAWRANLNAAGSPRQLKEAIDTGIELLGGRLQALQSQYEVGMGKPKDFHFLSEKSRAILKKLGANVDAIDGTVGSGNTTPSAQPKPVSSGVTHAATRDANGNWTIAPVGGR